MPLGHKMRRAAAQGWPTYNLNITDGTFTPYGMLNENPTGYPYGAGLMSQCEYKTVDDNPQGDRHITDNRTAIVGNFSSYMDIDAGTAIVIWRNEQAIPGTYDPTIVANIVSFDGTGQNYISLEQGRYIAFRKLSVGICYSTAFSANPGDLNLIIARWDYNTIDGTNYLSVAINNSIAYNITSNAWGAYNLFGFLLGDDWSGVNAVAAQGMIVGLAVYPWAIYDGTYGLKRNGSTTNELDAIWNGGAIVDPAIVLGPTALMGIPFNGSQEKFVTGTGNAWSWPYKDNLITPADAYSYTTYASSNWNTEGSPATGPADISSSEQVYQTGGYEWSSNAVDQGINIDVSVNAADSFYINVMAHSDGTGVPRAILYDQTGGVEIAHLDGRSSSTKTDIDELIFTGVAPAGCSTLRVKIVNTQASGKVYFHRVLLHPNVLTNPGFEGTYVDKSGGGGGTVDIAPDWENFGLDTTGIDTASKDTVTHVRSGSASQYIKVASTASIGIKCDTTGATQDKFYGIGGHNYEIDDGVHVIRSPNTTHYRRQGQAAASIGQTLSASHYGSWQHRHEVAVAGSAASPILQNISNSQSAEWWADDYYIVELNDVSLTSNPASYTNCLEPRDAAITQGVRVAGGTWWVIDPSADITAKKGKLRWQAEPRHTPGEIGYWNSAPVIFELNDGSGWKIVLAMTGAAGARTLKLNITTGLGSVGSDWTIASSGEFDPGTRYLMELEYIMGNYMALLLDGVEKINQDLSTMSPAFNNAPTILMVGNANGAYQCMDMIFSAPE